MNERSLPAGTPMIFGVPTSPMPETVSDAIGQAVAQVPGIREAYLPQCYIQGDTEPRQILVVGVRDTKELHKTMHDLIGKLNSVLPTDEPIDILPFRSSRMPRSVRIAECKIYGSDVESDRPWWKFW